MNLHVLTAVTRPDNLPALWHSIYDGPHPDWTVYWHSLHLDQPAVGGQTVKNQLLDETLDGWVYILDDDNLMHPAFLHRTADVLRQHPDADVLFFARIDHGAVFQPEVKVGSIDISQALIRRSLINHFRIPDLYDGDGWFLQTIIGEAQNAVFLNEPLAFYNRLQGG